MAADPVFEPGEFLPYLLNRAAEESSIGFQAHYRQRYGMLRTEWRVLFHLGRFGSMSARDICDAARLHKTKVSRAVAALEDKRFLSRRVQADDRRVETLVLTRRGVAVYRDLADSARAYDAELSASFTADELGILKRCLTRLSERSRALR